jgi:hypothetical protein
MAEIIRNYFTPRWRSDEIACVCGWRGDSRAMAMELHEEVTDYACPACECMLLIVSHPSLDQVRQAATEGNLEASQQLSIIEEALATHGKLSS